MLSPFPTFLPFMLFAFVASITPGPTNILVLSNSARYGLAAAMPIIFGACASAALIVLLVGTGAGASLVALPMLQTVMRWIGVTWLSYLAWQIFRVPAQPLAAHGADYPVTGGQCFVGQRAAKTAADASDKQGFMNSHDQVPPWFVELSTMVSRHWRKLNADCCECFA